MEKVIASLVSMSFSFLIAAHQNNFCFDFKSLKRKKFYFFVFQLH